MKRIVPAAAAALALALGLGLGLAGCAGTPTRFYTLAAPLDSPAAAAPVASPVYVELAPLALPERLVRPQLVVRGKDDDKASGRAKIMVLDDYQWVSSFEYELRDALANRVARRLGAINTTVGGRPPGQAGWRIEVEVVQFDQFQDQRVDVALGWTVRRTDGGPASSCRWSTSEPVGPGIDALAEGAQRATARAADAIAGHIASLAAKQAPNCGV